MKSHYEGHTKHFLKLRVKCEELTVICENALGGKEPHYGHHLTLGTIHVNGPEALATVEGALATFEPYPTDEELLCRGARPEFLGRSHVKFLALWFSAVFTNKCFPMLAFMRHLKRFTGDGFFDNAVFNDDNHCIGAQLCNDGISIYCLEKRELNFHLSLFSSNDLKMKNPALYKEYKKDERAFIDSLGLPQEFVLKTGPIVIDDL
jgi:hypothetical protein